MAVAAAKDAIAQAAAEEEPEGDEEEMIDVAAATDAPSMEEVSPSHIPPSFTSIILRRYYLCTALSQPWKCNVQEAAQVAAVAEEVEEAAAAARPLSKKAKKRAAKEAAAKAQAEGAPSSQSSCHTFSLLGGPRCIMSLLHLPALPIRKTCKRPAGFINFSGPDKY